MGHFCPYSIVPTDKYVRNVLKTQKRNRCQEPRFAKKQYFLANVALFHLFNCDVI